MGVISRLPQGGGGGGFVFNITTTEASLFGQDVFITGAETKTVRLSAEGKATVKTKKAGTYTFTCGAAVWSDDYQFYGEYTVVLTLYDAIVNVTGLVSLAPEMDANYIVPGGYYKPNSVDGFQVSLYDGATQIDAPKFFSGGVNTVTFTVDTRVHTNVTVKFSDEDGFITPANVPLSLTKGVTSTASGTWSEKYAVLEVEKADAELLPFNVELSWGASADEKITWQTDNVTVKSQFICKSQTSYTVTCGDDVSVSGIQIGKDELEKDHAYQNNPVKLQLKRTFWELDVNTTSVQLGTTQFSSEWIRRDIATDEKGATYEVYANSKMLYAPHTTSNAGYVPIAALFHESIKVGSTGYTKVATSYGGGTGKWAVKLPQKNKASKVVINIITRGYSVPIRIYGSDDSNTWTQIGTGTVQNDVEEEKEIVLSNTNSYLWYKVEFDIPNINTPVVSINWIDFYS